MFSLKSGESYSREMLVPIHQHPPYHILQGASNLGVLCHRLVKPSFALRWSHVHAFWATLA